jgi:hypothetical protein
LRSKVEKSDKEGEKFFVRTRTAALGVRGTDFQTIYNHENHITSLVTFEGEVAMVKSKDDLTKDIAGTKETVIEIERDSGQAPRVARLLAPSGPPAERLSNLLKSKDTVVVKQGQYAGAVTGLHKATLPVILNPAQLNALYKNEDLIKASDSATSAPVIDATKTSGEEIVIRAVRQEAPPEGAFDAEKGTFAPKAGGFIDIATGLYVPPTKDALFDRQAQVFVDQRHGSVDPRTGEYSPPAGLTINPTEGFVLDPSKMLKMSEGKEKNLLAMSSELNATMGVDVILGDAPEEELEKPQVKLSFGELVARDTLSFQIVPYSQKIEVAGDTLTNSGPNFESEDASLLRLSWAMAAGPAWQPVFHFTKKSEKFRPSDLNSTTASGSNLTSMGVEMRRVLSARYVAYAGLSLDQQFFLDHPKVSGVTSQEIVRVTLPTLSLGVAGEIIQSGRFFLAGRAGLLSSLPKDRANLEVSQGFGTEFAFDLGYWAGRTYSFSLGIWNQSLKTDVANTNSGFAGETSRSSGGLALKMNATF